MSTKIFNGFEIKTKSLKDLKIFIDDLKSKLEPIRTQKIYQKIAKELTNIIDELYFIDDKKKFLDGYFSELEINNISECYLGNLIKKLIYKKYSEIYEKNIRNPSYDFGFSLSFIPVKNKVLGLYWTEDEDMIKTLFSYENIKEYKYYNNTDRPKTISKKSWDLRSKYWDYVYDNGTPSTTGFTWQLSNNNKFDNYEISLKYENIKNFIDNEKRLYKMSYNFILNNKLSGFYNTNKNNNFKILMDTQSWLETDEGLEKINEVKSQISLYTIDEKIFDKKIKDLYEYN